MALRDVRFDETTWESATPVRRMEWRAAIEALVAEGRLAGRYDDAYLLVSPGKDAIVLDFLDDDGEVRASERVSLTLLADVVREYVDIIGRMDADSSIRDVTHLEALDMAKKVVHDKAARVLTTAHPDIGRDLGTYRRLFTLLLVTHIDTTALAHARGHRFLPEVLQALPRQRFGSPRQVRVRTRVISASEGTGVLAIDQASRTDRARVQARARSPERSLLRAARTWAVSIPLNHPPPVSVSSSTLSCEVGLTAPVERDHDRQARMLNQEERRVAEERSPGSGRFAEVAIRERGRSVEEELDAVSPTASPRAKMVRKRERQRRATSGAAIVHVSATPTKV